MFLDFDPGQPSIPAGNVAEMGSHVAQNRTDTKYFEVKVGALCNMERKLAALEMGIGAHLQEVMSGQRHLQKDCREKKSPAEPAGPSGKRRTAVEWEMSHLTAAQLLRGQ